MLRLSEQITNTPVLSLRTGGKVAQALEPIINPNNLVVEGWFCQDSFSKETLILLAKDVRDFVPQGIAINDHADLAEPEDLIRLKEVLELNFELISKHVVTNKGRNIGKVTDYALDSESMLVKKLYVARPVYKSFTEGQLSIDRSQIVEITNKKVIVKDVDVRVGAESIRPLPAHS